MTTQALLANDTDVDGDPLTVTGLGAPTGGTVSLSGGSVTFTFTVTGTGITYQWYFNGVAISGALNFSYTIGSVTAASSAPGSGCLLQPGHPRMER